jgi:hypothetical protein
LQHQACMHALRAGQQSAGRAWGQNTWTDVASSAQSSAIVAPCRPRSPVTPDWVHAAVLRHVLALSIHAVVQRPQQSECDKNPLSPHAPGAAQAAGAARRRAKRGGCVHAADAAPAPAAKQGASERGPAVRNAACCNPTLPCAQQAAHHAVPDHHDLAVAARRQGQPLVPRREALVAACARPRPARPLADAVCPRIMRARGLFSQLQSAAWRPPPACSAAHGSWRPACMWGPHIRTRPVACRG